MKVLLAAMTVAVVLSGPLYAKGSPSAAAKQNPVYNFFQGVELQAENEGQENNISAALKDALTLPEKELKEQRYENYQGQPSQWDLQTLIQRHFVPDDNSKTLGLNFYHDIKAPSVQNQLRKILKTLP